MTSIPGVHRKADLELQIEKFELLLLVAAVVAILTRVVRFPYTVGLVVTGVLLSFVPFVQTVPLTKELLFSALLPPLIFEAALFLPWKELRREMPIVTLMATLGVVAAALVTTLGLHWLAGWPLISAGIFGILISATDPVSVIATFKEMRVTGRLRLLVESESLFNDGTAAVFFALLLSLAQGESATAPMMVVRTLWTVGGALACGGLLALTTLLLAGRTTDHLVEVALTTVCAYGSFLLAEHLHCSGVLATLTAGLVVGNRHATGRISPAGRDAVDTFWEFAAFVANSLVFLLIGLHEAHQDFSIGLGTAALAIGLVTVGRAAAIYPICLLFSRSRLRVSGSFQHVMVWGGLRGALALALALGLPADMPLREEIVSAAFAVVAFSVIVQGLTMTPLLRQFGLLPAPPAAADTSPGRKP